LGRAGRRIADNQTLKDWEAEGNFAQRYIAQQARRAGEATAGSSFDVRNTGAVDGGGDFNRREGGFDEAIQDQKDFRQERKKSVGEKSAREKERIEKAKLKKQQIQDSVEDKVEEIEENKSAVDNKLERQKDPIQEEIEGLKNALQERKEDHNSYVSEIEDAIDTRDQLKREAAEAIDNGNDERLKQIRQQQANLVDNTEGVSRLDDLEDLEDDIESAKDSYQTHKSRLEAEIESKNDQIEGLEFSADRQKASLENSKRRLEDNLEEKEEQLNEVINAAKNREETYAREMLRAEGIFDSAISRARQLAGSSDPYTDTTIPTQANRQMGVEEVENIEDDEIKRQISRDLRA
jgi:chromosome segregation ATPase